MTMHPRCPAGYIATAVLVLTTAMLTVSALSPTIATAQGNAYLPPTNYLQRADLAPGAVGQSQLRRSQEFHGYFQPVELIVPDRARVSVAQPGGFSTPTVSSLKVGLQIGQVYRFQITNVHNYEGREVYPSIEVINRLHPPQGQELKFPIPVEITAEELKLAFSGAFVTRVIYLETPDLAAPFASIPGSPQLIQVGSLDDPLQIADRLGRPMAILRIGSRVPDTNSNGIFSFNTPALLQFSEPNPEPSRPDMAGRDPARVGLEEGIRGQFFPRLPDSRPTNSLLATPQALPQRILR